MLKGRFSRMTVSQIGRGIAFVLMLGAFAMYLAVSISIPVTRLNFLSYVFNGTQSLLIGMWGSCTAPISASGVVGSYTCTKAKLGFLVDLTMTPGRTNGGNPYVVGNLASGLVLFVIATIMSFGALFALLLSPHLAFLACQGSAVMGMAGMIIMFILFERTDDQIRASFHGVVGGQGAANWMGLAGGLMASVAVLFCIMGFAQETTKNGSLIDKEKFDDSSV